MTTLATIIEAHESHFRSEIPTLQGQQMAVTNGMVTIALSTSDKANTHGLGELQLHGSFTGDKNSSSLRYLRSALKTLKGQTFEVASYAEVAVWLEAILNDVKSQEEDRSESGYVENVKFPVEFGGVDFSIQSAMKNALRELVISLEDSSEIVKSDEKSVAARSHVVFPMLRPLTVSWPTISRDVIKHPALADGDGALWIDFGRRMTVHSASRWISSAASLLKPTQRIYMYRPLKKKLEGDYLALLNEIPKKVPAEHHSKFTVIQEIQDDAPFSPDLSSVKTVEFGFALRPYATGSPLKTLNLLEELKSHSASPVFLLENTGSTNLAKKSILELADVSANVHGLVDDDVEICSNITSDELILDHDHWKSFLEKTTSKLVGGGEDVLPLNAGEEPNYYEEEKYLGPVGAVGSKARLLQKAALLAGMNTVQYTKSGFMIADQNDRQLLFHGSATPINTAAAKAICNHKETTRLILQRANVPVPQGRSFKRGDFDTARKYAEQLGYPVVVKPAMGTMGIGVKSGIQNETELNLAFSHLESSRLANQDFIVEKHLYGEEYRILVIGGEVIAAVRREPASVVGDGQHNVAELISRKNRFRRSNPQLASSPIVYTSDSEHLLKKQGITLASIPRRDQLVEISSSSNISLGGDSREILDRVHPSVIDASIRAVKALPGLNYCGVDFLLEDPALPLSEQSAGICELNAQAASGTAEYPLYGTPRPVPAKTIEKCIDLYDLVPKRVDSERLALELTVRGRVSEVGYRKWFEKWAIEFGLEGEIWNSGKRTVRAKVQGDATAIAAMSAAALSGPKSSKPTTVSSKHIDFFVADGFSIRDANGPSTIKEPILTRSSKKLVRIARSVRRRFS